MNEEIEAELIEKFGFVPEGLCKPVNHNVKVYKKSKLVYGVGINDADYVIGAMVMVDGKHLHAWRCPAYAAWSSMLERAYDPKFHAKQPTYVDVTVCDEWHRFSTFREWFVEQDWQGNQLDKDLLKRGNKTYSPCTCLFVSQAVNNFFTDRGAARGEWPIGVSRKKHNSKFAARINESGKDRHLGYFTCPHDAHQAWLAAKIEQANRLADGQSDPRVADAILRYARELAEAE